MFAPYDERVFWKEKFHAETFDLRDRMNFCRFDCCTFVNCTLLMDQGTEQVAFTGCTFQDCNIDRLDSDDPRGIVSRDNFFDRPLNEKKKEFDERLAAILRTRGLRT